MKLRHAVSALTAAALVCGAPALAAAQSTSGNVEASTPVPNPPAKAPAKTHRATHHHKHKASHRHHASAAPTGSATAKK